MFQYYVFYKNQHIVVLSRLPFLDFLAKHPNIFVSADWRTL